MSLFNLYWVLLIPLLLVDHFVEAKYLEEYGKPFSFLGEGGAGVVRLYKRSSDNALFAVKEFIPENDDDDDISISEIKNEYNIGTSLSHDNIIDILDLQLVNGTYHLIMPYYPISLHNLSYTKNGLGVRQAGCIFRQLVDGLSYMHGRGVAHQDFKMSNVVLSLEGQAKIIDFGRSYWFRGLDGRVSKRWDPRGAFPNLPPEVYSDRHYHPQPVDIWALGITYAQMLLPMISWKTEPSPCDGLQDHFGILSPQVTQDTEDVAMAFDVGRKHNSIMCPKGDRETRERLIRATVEGLVNMLPKESRTIVGKMLEVDPCERASWAEILMDSWIRGMKC